MSTERVIVHESIADEFNRRLVSRVSKIRAGNHIKDPSVSLSGLFCKASADRAIALVKEAVDMGATLLLGDLKAEGTIVQPHIVDGARPNMKAFVEESFAPRKWSRLGLWCLARYLPTWARLRQ
jgi:acyl-CoA reductase-like NAD-dependent aldehyde dehydrogenase